MDNKLIAHFIISYRTKPIKTTRVKKKIFNGFFETQRCSHPFLIGSCFYHHSVPPVLFSLSSFPKYPHSFSSLHFLCSSIPLPSSSLRYGIHLFIFPSLFIFLLSSLSLFIFSSDSAYDFTHCFVLPMLWRSCQATVGQGCPQGCLQI
jgi:hypothetical protein